MKVSVDYAVRQVEMFVFIVNGPLNTPYEFLLVFHIYSSLYPWSLRLCSEAVINWLGKTWIFTQMFMLDCHSAWLYESVLLRTRMLLPNAGRKIPNWLLRIIFFMCLMINQGLRPLEGSGYGDAFTMNEALHTANCYLLFWNGIEQKFVFHL